MKWSEFFKTLETADPELAAEIADKSSGRPWDIPAPCLAACAEDIIMGLALERSFGRAIAFGFEALARSSGENEILTYQNQIRRFGKIGPELGKLMAEHLTPVLKLKEDSLFQRFLEVTEIMLAKGAYTLYGPLKTLDKLCEETDRASARAYLDLLGRTFALNLTYKQARPFTYTLPKAVSSFSNSKRAFQIRQLERIIQKDFELSDYFLGGLSKGLKLLSAQALDEFVEKGLEKYDRNKKSCAKFLSLEAKSGLDLFAALQVTVPLYQVKQPLHQYIKARTGFSVSLKTLSEAPSRFFKGKEVEPLACSDGKTIYLPDEIGFFDNRENNIELYKCLAKLEIGFFEFGSFDFDLEKLRQKTGIPGGLDPESRFSDFEAFINGFDSPQLASDLFTLFEHARIMDLNRKYYPGLVRKILPLLIGEWTIRFPETVHANPLSLLYQSMVLNLPDISDPSEKILKSIPRTYEEKIRENPRVETSAELVFIFYKKMKKLLQTRLKQGSIPFAAPFNRKIQADFFFSGLQSLDEKAAILKNRLEKLGIKAFRSDIRKKLVENNGTLSPSDIKSMILKRNDDDPWKTERNDPGPDAGERVDLSSLDLSRIMEETGISPGPDPDITGPAFYYKEWDDRLGDYLHNHTLVHEKTIPPKEDVFYENTLKRYQGMISRIKYAFERMKPEEISILRPWVEGDEFDYRALLDFAMDKKAGIMPSDKLYIKRIKQQRDVAVLLLVDLSRSTSNFVADSSETVLDVEKQAIVLFCEALEVVGDQYAIAGFSGTGRLGVDYFKIKDFDETLNQAVRRRINAMAPQRSTRMGAAIRHAAAQLEKKSSHVRLIILMGDGFPNDVDYKKEHAVSDTRKAILEARSKNIYTHALTVDIAGDSKLDDLYGNVHHNIISDVRELPDRLPRIYSTLTRH